MKDVILSKFTSGREKGIQKVRISFVPTIFSSNIDTQIEISKFPEEEDSIDGI